MFLYLVFLKAAGCMTEARSPEAPKCGVRATEFVLKEPELWSKHGVFSRMYILDDLNAVLVTKNFK